MAKYCLQNMNLFRIKDTSKSLWNIPKYLNRPMKWVVHKKFSSISSENRVCVIGSGPAGFGVSQYLLKNNTTIQVDMVEKYPTPYGLIRYGVAPDHQDVKNCIHSYERVAEDPRFSFYGNINVGVSISFRELMDNYTAVVLCTGAQGKQKLGILGDNLDNVFTSNEFVGWYNGVPEWRHVDPDLSGTTAVIIGVGNVALDCSRMLLKPCTSLSDTDITSYAQEKLAQKRIKKVVLIGRRGPLQMACTRKELSEITDLNNIKTSIDQTYFTDQVVNALKLKNLKLRKTQRLVKHLMNVSKSPNSMQQSISQGELNLKLLRTPVELIGMNNSVTGVILKKSRMQGSDAFNPVITPTEETEKIDCSIVITCIGYKNELPSEVIRYAESNLLKTRVSRNLPLFACGWCKTGPKGVLADTLNDCLVTGDTILQDLESLSRRKPNNFTLSKLLVEKQRRCFKWEDWKKIDAYEIEHGSGIGKVREKVTTIEKMMEIAFNTTEKS